MSLLEGDLINLHEYEHELIRAKLSGGKLPRPREPRSLSPIGFEREWQDENQARARDLFAAFGGEL